MEKVIFHFVITEYYPDKGGIQTSMRRIAEELTESFKDYCYFVYVLNTKANNNERVFYLNNFIKIFIGDALTTESEKKRKKEYHHITYFALLELLKENSKKFYEHQHIIISFGTSTAGYFGQIASAMLKIPHITSVRGSDFSVRFISHGTKDNFELIMRNAHYVVTTNRTQQNVLQELFADSLTDKITTIHNAVLESEMCRKETFSKDGRIRLFSDCGLSYKKGTKFIIDCFERLLDMNYNVQLTILGENFDSDNQNWKKLIDKCIKKHKGRFQYLGYRDDIQNFYISEDIYLSASVSEGCSNSRITALCTGTPMVSFDNGALPDYDFDRSLIYTSPLGNLSAFTKCVMDAIHEIQYKNTIVSKQDIDSIRSYFSRQREQKEWLQVIKHVINKL